MDNSALQITIYIFAAIGAMYVFFFIKGAIEVLAGRKKNNDRQ